MQGYEYFDEKYFNEGHSKGTVYTDYLRQSRGSFIYAEIGDAICNAVRPKRALEIGCATGIIVRHLNDRGVEAHGIDVSEWCIANREHPNVLLAGAERLPFPDNHFDFIYSVHALEHIPPDLKDAMFAELARVGGRGMHWHMLPIVGDGPYAGDPAAVVAGLKKDPTHNLLENREWWLSQFRRHGLTEVPAAIYLRSDGPPLDLSVSQMLLSGGGGDLDGVLLRIRDWNWDVLFAQLSQATRGARLLELEGAWRELRFDISSPLKANTRLQATVTTDREVTLRFAALSEEPAFEADYWRTFSAGTTRMTFSLANMELRLGDLGRLPDAVTLLFGGSGDSLVSLSLTVDTDGVTIFTT